MQNFSSNKQWKNSNKLLVRAPTDASNSNIIECARKKIRRQDKAYKFDSHRIQNEFYIRFRTKLEILFQVVWSSICKPNYLFFLFFTIYEWLSIEIHVYHDAVPELAQVPVLWLESYCGLSDGRSDDFVVFTTIYL